MLGLPLARAHGYAGAAVAQRRQRPPHGRHPWDKMPLEASVNPVMRIPLFIISNIAIISKITETKEISDFCKANNITPFMFFVSIFYILGQENKLFVLFPEKQLYYSKFFSDIQFFYINA